MINYKGFSILAAAVLLPFSSLASEDSAPYLFGGEVNYETAVANASAAPSQSVEQDALPDIIPNNGDDSFAPPPSDAIIIPQNPPAVPMIQRPSPVPETKPEENNLPTLSKDQELTATLKQDNDASSSSSIKDALPSIEGTWVDKLANSNPLSAISTPTPFASGDDNSSLEKMVDSARAPANANRRSNASVFDISGVMLRMSLAQVEETMQNRGFRKMMEKLQIPNFIKWRNEEYCRNSGVVGYERTEACVTIKAKKDKHEYVQTTKYAKFDTKEEIEVTFTSNFTDNKVYKIVYKSMAANSTGNSPKAVYLRNIKVYDFWKKINQKYGKPDNKNDVTWGMGGNKPYLKAKTGYLLLEDPMLRELDYTRMSREDQRYMNTDLYSF